MIRYADEHLEELKQLIRDLCAIPAPSNHEELRAEFCRQWFEKNGFENVFIDDALNVIAPVGVTEDGPVVAFTAHTDTVFPDTEPMPFYEDEQEFRCPGVGDDTANLAVLMITARYFLEKGAKPKNGMLFVANSCEEGLGNLKGIREIVRNYGRRMLEHVSYDGSTLNGITTDAVGSHRYRVTVRTEGGHSFGKFGNRNAIFYLSSIITSIYAIKVPQIGASRTTYNVGTITGGTSVNTIAQEASMLCEYRSDNRECLAKMQKTFAAVFDAYRTMGIDVEVELVGDRPCKGDVDEQKHNALKARMEAATSLVTEDAPICRSGSTDCNIPLSAGIPAACVGVVISSGAHTREEKLQLSGLPLGMKKSLAILSDYFEV